MSGRTDRIKAHQEAVFRTLIVSRSQEAGRLLSRLADFEVTPDVFRAIGLIATDAGAEGGFWRVVLDGSGLKEANRVENILKALSPGLRVTHGDSETSPTDAEGTNDAPPPHVLVVDDEQNIRESLREILDFRGYVTECAADGHEAIGKVIYRKSLGHEYKMILMDLKLKPDLDGTEAAYFIDGLPPEFRVHSSLSYISAFISAVDVDCHGEVRETGDFSLMDRFERLNFIRTLHKPVDAEELLSLVSDGTAAYEVERFISHPDDDREP